MRLLPRLKHEPYVEEKDGPSDFNENEKEKQNDETG